MAKRKKINEKDFEAAMKELLPYIKYTAYRLSWKLLPHVTIDDLISMGLIGLMDALNRFKPGKTKFKTYAELRIKGAMIDELRATAYIPRSMRKKINKIRNAQKELSEKNGKKYDDIEVAKAVGMSPKDYYGILQYAAFTPVSLEGFNSREGKECGDELDILESIADPNALNPLGLLESKEEGDEARSVITKAVNILPEKEKIVLLLYYYEKLTMEEVGRVLDITESRVCQIHGIAIEHLKDIFQKSRGNGKINVRASNNKAFGNNQVKTVKRKRIKSAKKKIPTPSNGRWQDSVTSGFPWN